MPPVWVQTIAAAVLGFIVWTLVASLIFCAGTQTIDLFVFPWLNWWKALKHLPTLLWVPHGSRGFSTWPLFWFVTAFLLPSMFAVATIMACRKVKIRKIVKPKLYGDARFADDIELEEGGITLVEQKGH